MKNISASDAKARFAQLLHTVERGETIGITRHGKRIARVVPEDMYTQRADDLVERLREHRKGVAPATVDEMIAWKNEGRR